MSRRRGTHDARPSMPQPRLPAARASPRSAAHSPGDTVVALCRAGFEPEAARDLMAAAEAARATLAPRIETGAGYVTATLGASRPTLAQWSRALASAPPVFARSVAFGTGPYRIAEPAAAGARPDRVTPLVAAVESLREHAPFGDAWLEFPDTNEGKQVSALARSLEARLVAALSEAGLVERDAPHRPRLHILLADGATAWVAASDPALDPAWPMGIARLHLPRGAPSRSTLKLAEAFAMFLGDAEPAAVRAGMRAVDLGAAPGGWTWQLAQRGLRVTAVDNGALKGDVARDPLVTHLREDGLRYRPRRPVDWVVCDIVESPSRIAALMGAWIAQGHARRAMFNLKLPMKKRYEEVERCRDIIVDALVRAGVTASLGLRQLYHDREEVTGYLAREDAPSRRHSYSTSSRPHFGSKP